MFYVFESGLGMSEGNVMRKTVHEDVLRPDV